MYSQPGRPGPGRGGRMQGRYMKGRLPEGVDFSNYPGRSSTPLPTAESKSAERINQLKIWNEAATNDDKRRLHTAKSKQALVTSGSSNRRTDSFKDARERHSASFQEKRPSAGEERDMFADRSDSESEEGREELPSAGDVAEQDDSPSASPDLLGGDDSESPESSEEASPPPPPEKKVEDVVVAKPITEPPAPKVDPVETVVSSQQAPIRHPVAKPVEQAHAQAKPVPKTRIETGPGDQSSNQPKRAKGCCVIQ